MATLTRLLSWCLGVGMMLTLPTWAQTNSLRADSARFAEMARTIPLGGQFLVEELQLDPFSPPQKLMLRRFTIFSSETRFVENTTQGPIEHPLPNMYFFQGHVDGQPKTLAYLSIQENGQIQGIITNQGRYWILAGGDTPGSPANGIAASEVEPADLQHFSQPFQCGADALKGPRLPSKQLSKRNLGPPKQLASFTGANFNAVIAIESDFEYFSLFGSSIAALAHASNLIGFASTVFSEEINIALSLGITTIWSAPNDPWTETQAECALYEFGRAWNNGQGSVDRTLAHFLSGKKAGGGIAWTGVLCQDEFVYNLDHACPQMSPRVDTYGGDFGFSGNLTGNFNPQNPSIVWDIYVFMHEIGHNFNSPHTHCYSLIGGNRQPIDLCSSVECGTDNCYCGATSLPCATPGTGCGTLMSYCHRLAGDLNNISLTYGTDHPHGIEPERVPQRMSQAVIQAHVMDPACIPAETTLADLLENWPGTASVLDLLPFVY